jgi:hypothetical protein
VLLQMEMESTDSRENRGFFERLNERISRPVSAPVVDIFRILTGALVLTYFIRLAREFSTYTSESGLLDHELLRELFWFTKITLFYVGSPPAYKWGLLLLGFLGALSLFLGVRPKVGAVIAWIVVVSIQRWNFAVINVDDSSITLLLWWMLFLPVGQTFTLDTLVGKSDWKEEAFLEVNGFFVRAFFANLFIYYLTAGLTKLGSELWREGLALYVVLNLPLARTQGFWQPEHFPFLWAGNHFTLIAEPLFPFLTLFRKGHPLKWLGGFSLIVFHLSIAITIGVPYANITLILTLALIFHQEIRDFLRKKAGGDRQVRTSSWSPPRGTRTLVCTYLAVLFLAMQKDVPVLDAAWEPGMAALYLGGVAQEYHLFDWIDRFNWTVDHEVLITPTTGEAFEAPSEMLFPKTVRGFIVQSYLLPMRWMRVPRPLTGEMRNKTLEMAAKRFVKEHADLLRGEGVVEVTTKVGRLDQNDLRGERLWAVPLMKFRYKDAEVTFLFPRLPDGSDT